MFARLLDRVSEYYLCWPTAVCLPIYLFHFYKNILLFIFKITVFPFVTAS